MRWGDQEEKEEQEDEQEEQEEEEQEEEDEKKGKWEYAQTSILVNFILVKLFSSCVIIVQGSGVTTCKLDGTLPLDLLYLPNIYQDP